MSLWQHLGVLALGRRRHAPSSPRCVMGYLASVHVPVPVYMYLYMYPCYGSDHSCALCQVCGKSFLRPHLLQGA